MLFLGPQCLTCSLSLASSSPASRASSPQPGQTRQWAAQARQRAGPRLKEALGWGLSVGKPELSRALADQRPVIRCSPNRRSLCQMTRCRNGSYTHDMVPLCHQNTRASGSGPQKPGLIPGRAWAARPNRALALLPSLTFPSLFVYRHLILKSGTMAFMRRENTPRTPLLKYLETQTQSRGTGVGPMYKHLSSTLYSLFDNGFASQAEKWSFAGNFQMILDPP
ncbi:hypothetical protein C8F01DRAFT_1089617 [Mycena amicta]|nr:hypothetical protein C8F01DRAFT_1089617 [Mycena amicta]